MKTKKKYQILMVEDNKADVVIVKEALNLLNHNIDLFISANGEEALNMLKHSVKEKNCKPDLVFLDLNIPKLNGFEVLSAIRKEYDPSSLPVILFTSSTFEEDVYSGYNSGANAVIYKPIDFNDYISLFNSVVNFWRKI